MIIGFDYWQCISHYPDQFDEMHRAFSNYADDVHIISAIGKNRIGTIANDVRNTPGWRDFPDAWYDKYVHEVVFTNGSKSSPAIKLAKCKELGIEMFFDDRKDVCDLLNANGILAFQVPRKQASTDTGGERE